MSTPMHRGSKWLSYTQTIRMQVKKNNKIRKYQSDLFCCKYTRIYTRREVDRWILCDALKYGLLVVNFSHNDNQLRYDWSFHGIHDFEQCRELIDYIYQWELLRAQWFLQEIFQAKLIHLQPFLGSYTMPLLKIKIFSCVFDFQLSGLLHKNTIYHT